MSNIIDSIQLSGTVYTIQGSGGGGSPTVELTQAEYDALVTAGTVAEDTYYIITDAQAGDLTQYWTSAQTQSAITQATSGKASQSDLETVSGQVANKQDTLVSGTNIKTINNESLLGSGNIDIQGGGTTYTAGRGIDITNDTISFSLPISAGTGNNSIKIGNPDRAQGTNSVAIGSDGVRADSLSSFAGGSYSEALQPFSMAFGRYAKANNYGEAAFGFFNKSNGSSGAAGNSSGNTLFSVGNGTNGYDGQHNAFEIRQNGDVYLNDGTNDVKLQDYIQIKVVKLTQSAYDALSPNYESNTLYIIKD